MPLTEEQISEIKQLRDKFADQYLNRVTDFIKYTTPLSLAALLWIGGSFSQFKGFSYILVIGSLALIFISIYFSILIFYMSIRYSSMQWNTYKVIIDFSLGSYNSIIQKMGWGKDKVTFFEGLKPVIEQASNNQELFLTLVKDIDKYNELESESYSENYDRAIKFHLYSLFLGFLFYIIAVI